MARSTAGPAASRFRSRPRSPVPLPDCRAGFASTAASAEQGIQKTSEGRREWSYCGLSSILHVLGHATTDMRFPGRDRADCGDRGLRAQRSPGTGDRIIPRFSIVSLYPPACPAGTIGAVPFRVAVTRRARRNTFQGERQVERRNASKTQARPEPPATCTLPLPGTCMTARRSLSAVSVSRSRLAGPARREQARAPRPATRRARPRAVCGATGPHPRRAPRPRACRDRTGERAGGDSRRTLMWSVRGLRS